MKSNIIVFYHDLCMDGFAAAAILYQYSRSPDFIPVNYRAVPDLDDHEEKRHIVFLDFTPPVDWVVKNQAYIHSLTIIDHHADKEADCEEIKKLDVPTIIYFDTNFAGSGGTWRYVNNGAMPEVIRLINNRDLWIATEEEREYHEYFVQFLKKGDKDEIFPPFLELLNYTKAQVETLIRPMVDTLITARNKNLDFHITKAEIIPVSFIRNQNTYDFDVAYLSAPYYYASEAAARLMENHDDVDLVINVTLNKKGVGLSFRSRKGTGWASWCAHQFDGGGHPDAAGGVFDYPVPFQTLHEMIFTGKKFTEFAHYLKTAKSLLPEDQQTIG